MTRSNSESTSTAGRPPSFPDFACEATGGAMRRVMDNQPNCRLLVLCGHTHGQGEVQVSENLQVLTGGAEYRKPVIQQVFDIE